MSETFYTLCSRRRSRVRFDKPHPLIIGVFIGSALLSGAIYAFRSLPSPPSAPDDVTGLALRTRLRSFAGEGATIIMFGDFECPGCRTLWPQLRRATENQDITLKLAYSGGTRGPESSGLALVCFSQSSEHDTTACLDEAFSSNQTTIRLSDLGGRWRSAAGGKSTTLGVRRLTDGSELARLADLGFVPTVFLVTSAGDVFRYPTPDSAISDITSGTYSSR